MVPSSPPGWPVSERELCIVLGKILTYKQRCVETAFLHFHRGPLQPHLTPQETEHREGVIAGPCYPNLRPGHFPRCGLCPAWSVPSIYKDFLTTLVAGVLLSPVAELLGSHAHIQGC